MTWERTESPLKPTYYRSFLWLVVILLILVFVGAEVAIGYIVRSSTIETIDAPQENVATTISSDARTNSLQLSHFVYNNNGEFLQTAVQGHHSSPTVWTTCCLG